MVRFDGTPEVTLAFRRGCSGAGSHRLTDTEMAVEISDRESPGAERSSMPGASMAL